MALIRWFVGLIGSLAALAAAIQCLIALVKLVKEVMDGVEKGLSIRKALQERKAEKNLIIPGTPMELKEVLKGRHELVKRRGAPRSPSTKKNTPRSPSTKKNTPARVRSRLLWSGFVLWCCEQSG
jgi:hypothetical protein